tara:strand:+ start:279 stop:458 length:180 start_codon:yes stop_codon:yes gene_type:complete
MAEKKEKAEKTAPKKKATKATKEKKAPEAKKKSSVDESVWKAKGFHSEEAYEKFLAKGF